MKKQIIEIFGWYGAAAIVGAYALVSFSVLESTDLVFQLLNITGAIGIVVVSFYKRAYQPGALNIIWALIALVAILKILNSL
ncbi:MAG TPA: hypothetical protein ENI19_00555 [Candidatus Nealsonbacteria bacterium]|uniref:CBU-0592-like domain-containing protein n=1 Tax=marine sediment metagenome TaxID=412755 RepID=A0A0F9XIR7_9ZZZZ|nr:hypothetical protein [Candidatus Nealsonbacteria bacterium]HEB46182.1 hypothetical protein [Candidatus Nealsonbacteria bacterium]